MDVQLRPGKASLGTAPVFLTAISTILGAVMFLRFGYAVGHVGFVGEALLHDRERVFGGYEGLGNILFVNTTKEIPIQRKENEAAPAEIDTPHAEPQESRPDEIE